MIFKKVIAVCASVALMCGLCACQKQEPQDNPTVTDTESESTQPAEDVELTFWYTDPNMTDYFEYAIDKYQKQHTNVTVELHLVASNGYLENINTQSIKQTKAVDVYMLPHENLEQAFLAGLAKSYDSADTVYNVDNYGSSAIRAVTYQKKQIAYPLYFDSAFLLYNKLYVPEAPATFDALLNYSNNLEYSDEGSVTDNIEKTLIWPVSDYTYNYAFLSDAFVVGGVNGDDRSQVDINNETVTTTLMYYQILHDYFAIDRKEMTEEVCLQSFMEGKNAFIFAKSGAIKDLMASEIDFGTACMPDLTDEIKSSSISYTQTLVLNPYSLHEEEAKKLIQALCYDYVDVFYGMTGFFPSSRQWNYDYDKLQGIYENYHDSTPRPKMMSLGDLYIEMDILLHKVWDDNGEIPELLQQFQDFVITQLN